MLDYAAVDDVHKDGIPAMADRCDDRFDRAGHFPDVMSKGKDRPNVIDGTKLVSRLL